MRQYTSFVGMDTHARSIALASFDSATEELATRRLTGCPGAAEVAAWASGHTTGPTLFAYESGPTGFGLARGLSAVPGADCGVLAVSTIARSQKEVRMKCDPLDARTVLREISSPTPTCSFAWVPSEGAGADPSLPWAVERWTSAGADGLWGLSC